MWKIKEQEGFIFWDLYKTQNYRINRNSMDRTSVMLGEMINVPNIFVWKLEGKRHLRVYK